MFIEIWKDIEGYENKYQISNTGKVKSLSKSIIMKPMLYANGYLGICLWKGSKKRNFLIHRLVAIAFVSNPNGYDEINHIDEDKTNNFYDNLEWCTHKYNINYGQAKKKISLSNKGRILSKESKNKIGKSISLKRWINNGKEQQYVDYDIAEQILLNDSRWKKGRLPMKGQGTKNYVWVHNNKIVKTIPKNELNEYLSKNWKIGRKEK